MRIIDEWKLNLDDLGYVPQRNTMESRSQFKIEREYFFYHSPRQFSGIPIFCANMAAIAGFEMGKALAKHKMCTALHKFFSLEELTNFYKENISLIDYVWPTIGKNDEDIKKLQQLTKNIGIEPNVIIDVPNGHLEMFVKYCAKVRNEFPNSIIMGGNIIGPEMTNELILHGGLDIVKSGIGGGAQCTTSNMTGVRYGSASLIIEGSSAAHGLKSKDRHLGLICADGGMKEARHFGIAFGLGADFVMAGTYFAGLAENCGEWTYKEDLVSIGHNIYEELGYKFKEGNATKRMDECIELAKQRATKKELKLYGMSSKEAQIKHYGEYKKYRTSEGRSSLIPYKGTVDDIVQELTGSLRSTSTYIGAMSLKDFSKCAVFCKIY